MEEKESPKAPLENRKLENRKFIFIAIGAVLALAIIFIALKWDQKPDPKEPTHDVVTVSQDTTINTFDSGICGNGLESVDDSVDDSVDNSVDEPDHEIPVVPDKMPAFRGDIGQWVGQHLKYPISAAENGVQGRVIVNFVIEKDGEVTHVEVAKRVDPSLDKEAIRVVNSMPAWNPGENKGKKVRVSYSMPINFELR